MGNLSVLLLMVAVTHDNAEGSQFVAGIVGCPHALVGEGALPRSQEVVYASAHSIATVSPGDIGVLLGVCVALPGIAEPFESVL